MYTFLLTCLLAAPTAIPQVAHRQSITHVAVSDSRKWVASRAINDDRILFWDLATGLIAGSLKARFVESMTFNDDSTLVVGEQMGVKLYRVPDGTLLASYPGGSWYVQTTSDGRYALATDNSGQLSRMDLSQRLANPAQWNSAAVKRVATDCRTAAIADNGRTALCIANGNPASVVDIEKGEIRKLAFEAIAGDISADGKTMALLGTSARDLRLFEVASLKELQKTTAPDFEYDPTGGWSWPTVKMTARDVTYAFKKQVRRFSLDRLALLAQSHPAPQHSAHGHALSRDASLLVIGVENRFLTGAVAGNRSDRLSQIALFQLTDKDQTTPARVLDVARPSQAALSWTSEGVRLAQRFRRTARVTNLSNTDIIWEDNKLPALREEVEAVAQLSSSGRFAAFATPREADDWFIIEVASGKRINIEKTAVRAPDQFKLEFSLDDRFLLISDWSRPRIVSVETGRTIYQHNSPGLQPSCSFAPLSAIAICGSFATNKYMLENGDYATLIDLQTSKVLAKLPGALYMLAPDGTSFSLRLHQDEVSLPFGAPKPRHVFNQQGKETSTQPTHGANTKDCRHNFLAQNAPDLQQTHLCVWSKQAIGMSQSESVRIVHDEAGKELFRFTSPAPTRGYSLDPDGTKLIAWLEDGDALLVDVTKKEVVARVVTGQDDWLVLDAGGYYAAARGENRLIGVRDGIRLLGFRDVDEQLNRPDIVLPRIGASAEVTQQLIRAQKKRLARMGEPMKPDRPTIELRAENNVLSTSAPQLQVELRAVASSGHTITSVAMFVNDVPVAPISTSSERNLVMKQVVLLNQGINRVDAVAFDERQQRSLRSSWMVRRTPPEVGAPKRYVLAVGVSNYAVPELKLDYAAKDAEDLARSLSGARQKLLRDSEVTAESMQQAADFFADAGVDDEAIVFLAGHGFLDAQDNYWFGSYDIDPQDPTRKGVPWSSIESLFAKTKARKRWLLVDTCHSGSVDRDEAIAQANLPSGIVARGLRIKPVQENAPQAAAANKKYLGDLFSDVGLGTGATVLASASGVQLAQESAEYRNGLFTYAVLEALKDQSLDTNRSGSIELSEVRDGVVEMVRIKSQGLQTPNSRRENYDANFSVRTLAGAPPKNTIIGIPPANKKTSKKKPRN